MMGSPPISPPYAYRVKLEFEVDTACDRVGKMARTLITRRKNKLMLTVFEYICEKDLSK
jgi:hypothetical protein